MRSCFILILIFCLLLTVQAQTPQFTWGSPVKRNPENLQNLQIVGVDKDGFFVTYQLYGKTMLDYFNSQNERLWTTALVPKSPDGETTQFHSLHHVKGNLYMISSLDQGGQTTVFAQQIKHSGNYANTIYELATGEYGKRIHVASSRNENALMIVLSGDNKQTITSVLLSGRLTPRWTRTLTSSGNMQEVLVHDNGTAFILTKALPAAPATTSFYLYRLQGRTGKIKEIVLGDSEYRPLKAQLSASPNGETIVAGYVIPSSSVANQKPEPVGTLYYRFNTRQLQNPIITYMPFETGFIESYKRFKPDNDVSQRFRNLQLHRTVPTSDGGIIMIGEVSYRGQQPSDPFQHYDDIVIIRLSKDGEIAYMTSANKLQVSAGKGAPLHSYFATTSADTVHLIYQDFAYYNTGLTPPSPYQAVKTPVLISILPDGSKRIYTLTDSATTVEDDFYILPASAYPVSDREIILLGVGEDYYRFGRMYF